MYETKIMTARIPTKLGNAPAEVQILCDWNNQYRLEFFMKDEIEPTLPDVEEVYTTNGYHHGRKTLDAIHHFYGEKDGLVIFYVTDDFDEEHGPDYPWSSNSAEFNRYGYCCMECSYHSKFHMAGAITLDKAIELCERLGYGVALDKARGFYFIIDRADIEFQRTHDYNGRSWYHIDTIILQPTI